MSRRANGEGSIYQRKDGRWSASVSVGNLKRKHFLGHTRTEVAAKMNTALKTQQDGLPVRFERQRFDAYIKGWLADVRGALKPRTWTRYEQLMRVHATPVLGTLALEKITPQHLQRLYRELEQAGSGAGTVRQLHAVLHKAFKQATLWNLVPRNVADAVTPPRPKRQEMKTLSPEQARTLLQAAEGDRYEALFVLALSTGMRQGELLGLRWQDVDVGNLRIQSSMQRTKDGFVLAQPKTNKSRRQILLTEQAKSALRQHRVDQGARRLLIGAAWKDMNLVFTNEVGGPVEASHLLRHCFYPLLTRAELPRIRFHDLRHTAATLLLAQGIHPKIVSEMLGHSNIYITLDLYSHVTPTMQQQAVDAMEMVLKSSEYVGLSG
jgi:integrase